MKESQTSQFCVSIWKQLSGLLETHPRASECFSKKTQHNPVHSRLFPPTFAKLRTHELPCAAQWSPQPLPRQQESVPQTWRRSAASAQPSDIPRCDQAHSLLAAHCSAHRRPSGWAPALQGQQPSSGRRSSRTLCFPSSAPTPPEHGHGCTS